MKTVVIADDTAFVRDRFRTALEEAGHRAVAVSTGADLLETLRRDGARVDLVVMDLRLPNAQGLNLVRAIRKLQPVPPIVVFSGTIGSASEVRELATLGITGYINEYTAVQHIVPSLAPHLFPGHYNRRSSPRVGLSIPVAYRFSNTIATSITLNIGYGGVAVRTTNPLPPGTVVKVRLRVPGGKKEIETEARVAWSDRRVGMGLQFTSLLAEDRDALVAFVQAHFFSNRKA